MATIYRRGKYYWISYRDSAGRRIQKSTGLTDKITAEKIKKYYSRLEKSYLLTGTPLEPAVSIAEWMSQYLERRKNRVAPGTIQRDRQSMESLIKTAGNKNLKSIKPEDCENWLSEILKTKSTATANCMLRHCKTCLKHAVKMNYLKVSPLAHIRPVRENIKAVRILTYDEIQALLKIMPEEWQNLLRIALATGARSGELCRLKKDDVNITEAYAVIHSYNSNPTKSKKSRTVPIPDSYISLFKTLKKKSRDYLLTNRSGNPWKVAWITRGFSKYAEKAGIKCTFHDLRRTYGAWLLMAGADIVTIKENLGHSDISVTVKHYAQVLTEHRKRQADKLPAV